MCVVRSLRIRSVCENRVHTCGLNADAYDARMIVQRAFSSPNFALSLLLLLGCSSAILRAQPRVTDTTVDLSVTNGLIRWWPNLFDVRDEITGQEGVVMGVLPPVETGADDETEFGRQTGWVQLQPAITNEVFTLAFWVFCRANRPIPICSGEIHFQGAPGRRISGVLHLSLSLECSYRRAWSVHKPGDQ